MEKVTGKLPIGAFTESIDVGSVKPPWSSSSQKRSRSADSSVDVVSLPLPISDKAKSTKDKHAHALTEQAKAYRVYTVTALQKQLMKVKETQRSLLTDVRKEQKKLSRSKLNERLLKSNRRFAGDSSDDDGSVDLLESVFVEYRQLEDVGKETAKELAQHNNAI